MPSINILSEKVANQIAAGEVISRPASCVKEMLENSIDAGAGNIHIKILNAGKKLIEIKDDGTGMDEEDAKKAFLRHATSKIRSIEDLDYIETLGFRGEALASIGSVARVELITKTAEDETGTYLLIEGSKAVKEEKKASNTGTIIRVKDLFFNTPARRKFLKSKYTEETHIIDTVTKEGLAKQGVGITLVMDDKEVIVFPKSSTLKERIKIIQGKEVYDNLVEIGNFTDNIKVHGFIGKPAAAKNSRSAQFLFVNGRAVSSRRLNYAVYEGYSTLLMKGMYPAAFIFIDINPSMVDVNIHPTKSEVKFRNESAVYNTVKTAVFEALSKENLTRSPAAAVPAQGGGYERSEEVRQAVKNFFTGDTAELFDGKKAEVRGENERVSVSSVSRKYLSISALGQIKKTYIVGEDGEGMIIIDQHAAHEKILYEKIMKDIEGAKMKMQDMLIPEVIELSPADKKIVENNTELMQELGFAVEVFGENEYKVSSHPVLIRDKAVGPFIREIIEGIREKGKAQKGELIKDLAATMACRAAIKAGDELNNREIEGLLNEYFDIEEPFSCPHGRPPIVKITFDEMEKMFKRKI